MSADQPVVEDPQLGNLVWNPTTRWWMATVQKSIFQRNEIGIEGGPAFETHLAQMKAFLDEIDSHHALFLDQATEFMLETEVILPENFIEDDDKLTEDEWEKAYQQLQSNIRAKLEINSVNLYGGILRVWLDTQGYTTDHLVQTHVDQNFQIIDMHT